MSEDELKKFEDRWKQLYAEGIEILFKMADGTIQHEFNAKEYTLIYTMAYDICTSKSSIIQLKCYERLCEVLRIYSKKLFERIRKDNLHELNDFSELWSKYENIIMKWIFKFFKFFDRPILKLRKNINLDYDLKNIFKEENFDKLKNELIELFLKNVLEEREGKEVNSFTMKTFVDFMNKIENFQNYQNLYISDLEQNILTRTEDFYNPIVRQKFNNNNFIEYIRWGIEIILKEENHLKNYLPKSTIEQILAILKNIIFFNNHKEILDRNNCFKFLLLSANINSLSISYDVFNEDSKSLGLILAYFKGVVREEMLSIIQRNNQLITSDDPRDVVYSSNFVEEFFNFFEKYNKIINEAFKSNNLFNIGYREVIENTQSNHIKFNNSYIFPFFIDKYFRKNNQEVDCYKLIEKVIQVFPTLPDKDVFIDTHRNLLSNRLLTDDFVSIDVEKNITEKMNTLCGFSYTSNVEVMINDFINSKKINESLQLNYAYFKILTRDCWPSLPVISINLPQNIKSWLNTFDHYFVSKNKNRSLQWSLINSIVEVKFKSNNDYYNLIMNTIQCAIIDLFNKSSELSLSDIASALGTNNDDLLTSIMPFITYNILTKSNDDRISSSYKLNKDFSSPLREIILLSIPKKEEIVRKEKIEDDRSAAIEAAIARTMKNRLRMSHGELVDEVYNVLETFKVKVPVIKKKIDNLIEREIIKRDDKDNNYYVYCTN